MHFKILKKSKKSRARLGFIETAHGSFETPCLIPVATQAVVKTLTSEEAEQSGCKVLICNTFHLHLKPGEKIVQSHGGLHKFMNWKGALMTDSGGFQVFSLGFGKDLGLGKILKLQNGKVVNPVRKDRALNRSLSIGNEMRNSISAQGGAGLSNGVKHGSQSKELKITGDGVFFKSPVDGSSLFLGPKESIAIQEKLDADIVFAFDECTSPVADYEYTKKSLIKTHKWAQVCLEAKKTNQALFGIIQGGRFKDLRKDSARFIGSLEFEGFGIGGEFGDNKNLMPRMLSWVISELPERKPRHLLRIGHLEDIKRIIKSGVDMFDCTVPTHYARRGIAFTLKGRLDLRKAEFLKNKEPLDKNCVCNVCLHYTKSYICHLLRSGELTALKLITFHNLCYFNNFVENMRNKIKKEEI